MTMTKLLEQAINKIRELPEADQDDAAQTQRSIRLTTASFSPRHGEKSHGGSVHAVEHGSDIIYVSWSQTKLPASHLESALGGLMASHARPSMLLELCLQSRASIDSSAALDAKGT